MGKAFIKVDKVSTGSSTVAGFQGHFEAVQVTFPDPPAERDPSGTTAPRPAARVVRRVDGLSPALVDAYGSGRSLGNVLITAGLTPSGSGFSGGGEITLGEAKVLGYSASAADGAGPPTEAVLLGAASTSVRHRVSDVRYQA